MAASMTRFPIQRSFRFLQMTVLPLRHLTSGKRFGCSRTLTHFQLRYKTYLRIRKCFYSVGGSPAAPEIQPTFDQFIADKKAQAKKTILVQVKSRRTANDFFKFCKKHATVKLVHHYTLAADKEFLLVEFETNTDMRNILGETKFCDGEALPVHSQFVSYTGEDEDLSASVIEYEPPDNEHIHKTLLSSSDISEQMKHLFNETKLQDLETRLRFLVCAQLEAATSGIFPDGSVYPFGSTVNGCGQSRCDLDMVLDLKPKSKQLSGKNKKRSLSFQAKLIHNNSRMQSQRSLKVVGDIISVMLPGCVGVQRILEARVPIIKFGHSFTGIECDLCTLNMSGVYMSELIYLYGTCDSRLQPLLFTIRKWARDHGITRTIAGPWITNFQILMMVIFFLQQRPRPILPTVQALIERAGKDDERETDGVNCTFLRDINKFPKSANNKETLGELLMEFFAFYESFDFKDRGVSIVHGVDIIKSDFRPLYIENPLERTLNVSKNVGLHEIDKLKSAMRDALWCLENEVEPSKTISWGIVSLFKPNSKVQSKGFQVSSLFEEHPEPNRKRNPVEQSSDVEEGQPPSVYQYVVKEIVNSSLRKSMETKGRFSKVTAKTPVAAAVLPVAVTANPRKVSSQPMRSTRMISQSVTKQHSRNKAKKDLWKVNW